MSTQDEHGWTDEQVSNYNRMYDAARHGNLSRVIDACEYDNDVVHMADSGGRRALHIAAWINHPGMVDYLLGRGADVHAKESEYTDGREPMTALRIAELERFDEIAKVLRAAVNRQMTAEQKKQRQDLVNAIEKSDLDKVRSITEGKDRCDPVLQGTTAEGFTALHAAVQVGNEEVVKHLIATDAFLGQIARYGWGEEDPLDLANVATPGIVPVLDEAFRALRSERSVRGDLLKKAATSGNMDRVRGLVEGDGEDSALTRYYTREAGPLHWALRQGHVDVARYLIEQGATVGGSVNFYGDERDEVELRATALELANALPKAKRTLIVPVIEAALAKEEAAKNKD